MFNFINVLKENILNAYRRHKIFFFIILSSILISLIIGLITIVNYYNYLTIKNLTDKILFQFLCKKISLFQFFIRRFFSYLAIFGLIYIFSCNRFTAFLNVALACYLTFQLVFNIGILIVVFGFFGVLHALLITTICGLICLSLIIIFCSCCFHCCCNCCHIKDYFCNIINFYPIILFSICIIFIICLFEIIFLPFTTSALIVVF